VVPCLASVSARLAMCLDLPRSHMGWCDCVVLVTAILPLYLVTCLACDQTLSPPAQPPDLPQPATSCQGPFPTLVKVDLGHHFLGLENVVKTEPAAVILNRCSGQCQGGYNQLCQPVLVTHRNISVTVSYADTDLCEDTWVEVADVEQCGCVCSSTPCQGLAERDEETGCVCTCHVGNTTQCGDQRHLSPHLCECQCDAREDNTPCWWKHDWSEQSCSCALQLTRSDIFYGIISLLCLAVCLLALSSCYTRRQARQLQKTLDSNTTFGLSLNLLKQLVEIKQPKLSKLRNSKTNGVSNGNGV